MARTIEYIDPLAFQEIFWPDVQFYPEQEEIIYSVLENDETVVVAANQVGKDFVAGYVCVWFFLSAIKTGHTCRVVTTSVRDDHLRILWAEIGRFVTSAKSPLVYPHGPLVMNFHEIRRAEELESRNPVNYMVGMVSKKGEGMAGHHAEHTLLVGDEASGLDEQVHDQGRTWAKKMLWIGNANTCTNFFQRAVKVGNLIGV